MQIDRPDLKSLEHLVEALLLVADEPTSASQLAQALEVSEELVNVALDHLRADYADRGIRLQHDRGRFQLISAPEAAPYIERFLGLNPSSRLSNAALEVLAIIAYRQPVTRAQIESIRGVDCDSVLRTLVAKGLISEVGRLEQAGRPILYGTTFEFLRYFGIEDLAELPPLSSE